jgi:hypothetical protein
MLYKAFLQSNAYLELIPGVLIECAIVVQNVDILEIMSHCDLIIVGIVSWCDFNSTCAEVHVDHLVRYDREASVDEGVGGKFAVEVLV